MKLQETKPGCGAASICNALESLGDHAFQEVVSTIAGTSGQDGISEKSIAKTLNTLGYDTEVASYKVAARALTALRRALHRGNPVIICVDDNEHWVCVIGVLGPRLLVADSADAELVISYDSEKMAARWKNKTKRPFYGIVVSKRPKP